MRPHHPNSISQNTIHIKQTRPRPVTLDSEELLQSVRDAAGLRSFLLSQRLDVDHLQIVTMAADPARSAQATIVALQAGVGPESLARIVVGDSTVAIVDTPAGRICVESVLSGRRRYQVLAPGSRTDISGAVQRLIRRLPAGEEWYSYRRVV
ncbi:hypothetical protein MSHO_06580 [Mycobacterium shottsii]|uniref:ESX-2 secretion-associated protein EspG2 n=1 Tax=Mycobacterium shottsii TaxID=133549 RepID=A0A7I7L7T3_9MYCO|nr:hypothetical protein MSHO_06580 [Mycobacterium shottsii]